MSYGEMMQLAGMTALVGMGVVFLALFLLSVYMHYFKIFTARIEGRKAPAVPLIPEARTETPAVEPNRASLEQPRGGEQGARLAAAVAVALHLGGMRTAPTGPVAAAIGTAFALHRSAAARIREKAVASPSSWKFAGRLEAMASRSGSQGRARGSEHSRVKEVP